MMSMSERRRDPRLENNIPIKIYGEEGDVITDTANISRSGAYCRVDKYIAPMTKLKIQLLLPITKAGKAATKRISCHGVVVRAEPVAGEKYCHVAIFFNDISQRDSESISDFVTAQLDQHKN